MFETVAMLCAEMKWVVGVRVIAPREERDGNLRPQTLLAFPRRIFI